MGLRSEIHLLSLNHISTDFSSNVHASLPTFQDAILQMRVRDWRTIDATFRDVKYLFATHNKSGDYGIALPFKDFDLYYGERSIDFGSSTMPWYGIMTEVLERRLIPKSIKIWEGQIEAISYKMQCENTSKAYDLAFEKAVLGRLGRLSLVRLDY